MSQINAKFNGPLRGELIPPPDKSISHRAIMLASIAEGKSVLHNVLPAEDPLRTVEAFRSLGIEIEATKPEAKHENTGYDLIVQGQGLHGLSRSRGAIDCGNSGTTMRLLSGILVGQSFDSILTGDASLSSRPMKRIIAPLTEMGASIESEKEGYPPLHIHGRPLRSITYNSPIASAQVKSAILLAGLYCNGTTKVSEPGKSRDHTERMLIACGADIEENGLEVSVKGTPYLKPLDITVPGDLSSAAFFIVAGLLVPGSQVTIRETGINPTRTGIIDILKMMGGSINLENSKTVSGEPVADIIVTHAFLKGIDIDGSWVLKAVDEFPILCIAAACAKGATRITGARELRVKESDRIASMTAELRKMGVSVEELEDGLIIQGRKKLRSASVESHGDHRIAMSLAIAGLMAEGETTILNTDCVNTSFPGFMDSLASIEYG